MNQFDDHLQALYEEGQQRWLNWVALLNRLAEERGSSARFLADFGHLAGQAEAQARPLQATTPPPLPNVGRPLTPMEKKLRSQAWEETFGRPAQGGLEEAMDEVMREDMERKYPTASQLAGRGA